MESLQERFACLSIARRAEPSQEPTYLLELACAEPESPGGAGGPLVAVSCSDRSVRLHCRETLRLLGQCGGHAGPLCGLRFSPSSGSLLFSGSADGVVRSWDVRTPGSASPAQEFRAPASLALCSFDLSCGGAVLCGGTEKQEEDSYLVFWDVRAAGGAAPPLGVYSESHSDDVTQVRFHPRDPDRLASGSTDGLVNVFDVRRGCEEEALRATVNSESSVGCVRWAGRGADRLLCLSHDEGVFLWDLAQMDTAEPLSLLHAPQARQDTSLPGGATLDHFVGAAWLEEAETLLVLGGTNRGDLHLLDCGPGGLRPLCALRGGHSATVRCFHWDPAGGALLTGGEDGQLLLWRPGAVELSSTKKSSLKSAPPLKHTARGHGQRKRK
ncbi:WD repeat-containing protein 89 [Amia ocellicauda]|uniref:WD repeat-containing protein 89 n=1 Tax=Amia ocellicauda TaxID=2972642 RepID=UPI0034644F3A